MVYLRLSFLLIQSYPSPSLAISLDTVRYLILDEADKLMEESFLKQVDDVIAACQHPDITRGLFSATLPQKVRKEI